MKPTLGYPSQTEAVLALREQGLRTCEIADKVGVSRGHVVSLEKKARERMNGTRRRGYASIPPEFVDPLVPLAEARGMTARQLILKLLATIIDDGMVDAILDDGVEA